MGELKLGSVSLFAYAEKLLDVRQSRYAPAATRGVRTVDRRCLASLEGFILNGGIRLKL